MPWIRLPMLCVVGVATLCGMVAAEPKRAAKTLLRETDVAYPPVLPNGAAIVSDTSPEFLEGPNTLRPGVKIATSVPSVDFMFYPGQDYIGVPWSNWGDGSVANGKYYSAIGDHRAIGSKGGDAASTGTAFVYEYDPETKTLRQLVNTSQLLKLPAGHYTPGKIHTRVDMGRDGCIYFATHRGSPRAANDANHYLGDWIFRCDPRSGKSEVVVQAPVPKHSIPASVLDPERMIFYGATAAGPDAEDQDIQFFAYDVEHDKLLYSGSNGPSRYMMLAQSTGRLYYVPGSGDGQLMRFDPASSAGPVPIEQQMGIRTATRETKDQLIYTISQGQSADDADVWVFDTRTEKARKIGTAAVGKSAYVASVDVDPTGRFLYYVPGAHGGGDVDGSPVVQFDVQTGVKKVIAFLHPFYQNKYGFTPKGTYSTALSDEGDQLFVTWNVSRNTRAWDCCGLTVIQIPAAERSP